MIKNYPSDELSEMTVLGIAMLDAKQASTVIVSLVEDDFYAANLKNRKVFHAMKLLYDAGKAIDITTVTSELIDLKELDGIGGIDYLIQIGNKVTSLSNVEFYITNETYEYLLCFNHHDVLFATGTAEAWLSSYAKQKKISIYSITYK